MGKLKTRELPIYGIQTNAVSMEKNDYEVKVYLASGKEMIIKCDEKYKSNLIYQSLMYSAPNNKQNNAKDFDFELTIEIY